MERCHGCKKSHGLRWDRSESESVQRRQFGQHSRRRNYEYTQIYAQIFLSAGKIDHDSTGDTQRQSSSNTMFHCSETPGEMRDTTFLMYCVRTMKTYYLLMIGYGCASSIENTFVETRVRNFPVDIASPCQNVPHEQQSQSRKNMSAITSIPSIEFINHNDSSNTTSALPIRIDIAIQHSHQSRGEVIAAGVPL